MDKVGSLISSNKKYLNNLLIFLIVVEHFPLKNDFPAIYSTAAPLLNQLTMFMNTTIVKTILFIVLVWSCCIKKDMDTFILMSIFYNTYY